MSSPLPIDFQGERKKRRPGEERAAEMQQPPVPSLSMPTPAPVSEQPLSQPDTEPQCSCCTHKRAQVEVLLDLGRGILLCDGCIAICNAILDEEGTATDAAPNPTGRAPSRSYSSRQHYYCSFCGKEQEEVARLIAMRNNLYICNGCVGQHNAGLALVRSNLPPQSN